MKKIQINSKSLKFGSYAFAATIIVVAVIVLFNAILGFDAIRNRLRLDITKNRLYSLSETTTTALSKLEKDVEVIILTEEKYYQGSVILEVLNQYNLKSNGKVKLRFVDIEKDPTFVEKELDPDQIMGLKEGSIVVKSGKKIKVVNKSDMEEYDYSSYSAYPTGIKIEQAFTSAIVSVTADYTPVVYFATGHGEYSADKELSDLKAAIAANNYEVKELVLGNGIPDDASAIIFASPKTDLLAKELENLLKYLEEGGDAVFLMDVQTAGDRLSNFDLVFERYSLRLNDDFILEGDQTRYYGDFNIIKPAIAINEITEHLDPNSQFLLLPNCRSVTIEQVKKDWITTEPLFETSERSQGTERANGEQKAGPFLLGAISEYKGADSSKVALIGNAAFVTNDWMKNAGYNGERYILSTLSWMQNMKNDIYIPSKSLTSAPINLTASTRFISFIVLTFVLPLAVIGLGVFVWIRRKHL